MPNSKLSGIPAFTGEVVKTRFDPQLVPSFDDKFVVKARKVKGLKVPSIKADKPRVAKVKPALPTFDDQAEININKIN